MQSPLYDVRKVRFLTFLLPRLVTLGQVFSQPPEATLVLNEKIKQDESRLF